MAETILLATDGSDHAREAAVHAIELAAERGAELHVICVVDNRIVPEPGLSSAELATIAAEEHGHECITAVSEMAADRDVSVEGVHKHGIPHELIEAYAEEIDAGSIVVGKHGDHREHIGGVGRRLRDESDREVVVIDIDDS